MKPERGFTMIELLIVLVVMGLLMSLVAPLSLKAINRSDAKIELVKTKNWLRNKTNQAFLEQRDYKVVLNGRNAIVYFDGGTVEEHTVSYLTFPEQELLVNRFGVAKPNNVTAMFLEQILSLEIQNYETP